MARKCFMCGSEISSGILCEKCDKPRKTKSAATAQATTPPAQAAAPQASSPMIGQMAMQPQSAAAQATAHAPEAGGAHSPESRGAHALDAFPEAPVVKFPVENASPAMTGVVTLLVAAGVPSILIGPDRNIKFVSDEAKKLFGAPQADFSLRFIEEQTGVRVGDLATPASAGFHLHDRNMIYSLIPMSGGASGAVAVFRRADAMGETHASFVTYVREAVFGPLRSLRESLLAAAQIPGSDPLLADSAATVEQILSALEMAPSVDERSAPTRPVPTVTEVVRTAAEKFAPFAGIKGVRLQIDAQDLQERLAEHEQLAESLGVLVENAVHYVPAAGQVVVGVRSMEHKGKPLLLFFVMDNGPLVPESLRQVIFEPSFVWNPSAPERTGRSLSKVRDFAARRGGSVWVESKTGKACTFFLRVRPDGQ